MLAAASVRPGSVSGLYMEIQRMKSHVRVAVIGGGVVGCSVLYHLVKHGWKDVVLLERSELTSGSTWHAAGGMHTFNTDPNVAKLQDYTLKIYKEIEEVSGQSCGIHLTGGLMLADTQDRLDYLETARGRGRYLGLDTEFVDLQEAARMLPIMDPKHYVGVLYDPNEGHIDPSGVTHAYAGAARKGGAEVYRETRVTDLAQRPDGTWDVVTEKGTVHAEHVVNAAGLWAREVGLMAGVVHPFAPMEHQYVVTDEVHEIAETGEEMLHVIDFGGELYMRQEGRGVLVGTYEKHGQPWSEHSTPWDFGHELLPDDLDRIGDNLMRAFERFPALEKAGLKQIINGPFTFTPDGNPLVGPVPEVRNYWAACGVLAGFSQGGGVGLALANWMIDGDPGMDTWAMDVARFGDYAGPAYSRAMARQTYATRFLVPFPNEERPAGRPLRRTPIYDRLKAKGAVFGAAFGLEQALWYAPEGTEPVETLTFRRSNAHGPVGEECRAVREGVGITETSGFGKYEVTGPGAVLWLSRLLANRIPGRGTHGALADAQPPGHPHRRLHSRQARSGAVPDPRFRSCRGLPHALVPAADARRRRQPAQPAHRAHGVEHRGTEGARAALPGRDRGREQRGRSGSWPFGRWRSGSPRPWSGASPSPATSATRSG